MQNRQSYHASLKGLSKKHGRRSIDNDSNREQDEEEITTRNSPILIENIRRSNLQQNRQLYRKRTRRKRIKNNQSFSKPKSGICEALRKQGGPIEKTKRVGGLSPHLLRHRRRSGGLRVGLLILDIHRVRLRRRQSGSRHRDGGAEELDGGVLDLGHVLCAVRSLVPRTPKGQSNRMSSPSLSVRKRRVRLFLFFY